MRIYLAVFFIAPSFSTASSTCDKAQADAVYRLYDKAMVEMATFDDASVEPLMSDSLIRYRRENLDKANAWLRGEEVEGINRAPENMPESARKRFLLSLFKNPSRFLGKIPGDAQVAVMTEPSGLELKYEWHSVLPGPKTFNSRIAHMVCEGSWKVNSERLRTSEEGGGDMTWSFPSDM